MKASLRQREKGCSGVQWVKTKMNSEHIKDILAEKIMLLDLLWFAHFPRQSFLLLRLNLDNWWDFTFLNLLISNWSLVQGPQSVLISKGILPNLIYHTTYVDEIALFDISIVDISTLLKNIDIDIDIDMEKLKISISISISIGQFWKISISISIRQFQKYRYRYW